MGTRLPMKQGLIEGPAQTIARPLDVTPTQQILDERTPMSSNTLGLSRRLKIW